MAQVTGIVKIFVNGSLQRSKEGATLDMGGKERSDVVGHAVYGYTEKVVASACKFTLAHTADTDLAELNDMVGATLKFETDVGISYLITNAFMIKPCSLGSGGDVSCEMHGEPAVEE